MAAGPSARLSSAAARNRFPSGTTIDSGGEQDVYSGGRTSSSTINFGGNEIVHSAGIAIVTRVESGGVQNVLAAGTAIGTLLLGGTNGLGAEEVRGIVISATIGRRGTQDVLSGGTAISARITSDGDQGVTASASRLARRSATAASRRSFPPARRAAPIKAGGLQEVFSAGTAVGTVVGSRAEADVWSGGFAAGITVRGGGLEIVFAGGAASGVVSSGGTLELVGMTSIPAPSTRGATAVGFGAATTLAYSQDGGKTGLWLTAADGANAAAIALLGNYMAATFVTTADASGATATGGTRHTAEQPPLLTHPQRS